MPPEPSYLVGGYGEIEIEIDNLDNLINLGVPLSDLRLLCGSINGWGGEL